MAHQVPLSNTQLNSILREVKQEDKDIETFDRLTSFLARANILELVPLARNRQSLSSMLGSCAIRIAGLHWERAEKSAKSVATFKENEELKKELKMRLDNLLFVLGENKDNEHDRVASPGKGTSSDLLRGLSDQRVHIFLAKFLSGKPKTSQPFVRTWTGRLVSSPASPDNMRVFVTKNWITSLLSTIT
jgi:hypothetical protein